MDKGDEDSMYRLGLELAGDPTTNLLQAGMDWVLDRPTARGPHRAAAPRQPAAANPQEDHEPQDERDHLVDDAAANGGEDEELYAVYRPAKLHEGMPHPDPIVETASLASVCPPDPTYQHQIQDVVKAGKISAAQLETVVYANQRWETGGRLSDGSRPGFFLGDGAGVGKGREIAAVALNYWRTPRRKRRVLWLSVSNDLRVDARRDLDDVGARSIPVFPENNTASVPKGKLAKHIDEGVLFFTYSLLISRADKLNEQTAEVEATSLPQGSRLAQVVDWLNGAQGAGKEDAGDCVIVLDECHKAKNLINNQNGGKPSQTGLAVKQLQMHLPNARVLYSSATGASEPSNLAYMVRLGEYGFTSFKDMITTLKQSGLGSLELYSMGLKATGSYLSRTLSYTGAEFDIAHVTLDPKFMVMYDRAVDFWHLLFTVFTKMQEMGLLKKRVMSQFWGAHLRFFKAMLMAAKVPECAALANEAIAAGMSVVIGLQSTGEANTNAAREETGDEMTDFVSAPMVIAQQLLQTQLVAATEEGGPVPSGELDALMIKVYQSIKEWEGLPSCAEAAAVVACHGAITATAATGRYTSAAPAATRASDDDDDVVFEGERSLDEVLQAQKADAIRTGRFIDLTTLPNADEVEAAAAAIDQHELDEKERKRAAKEKEQLEKKQHLKAEAEEALQRAQATLAKLQWEAQAAHAEATVASTVAERRFSQPSGKPVKEEISSPVPVAAKARSRRSVIVISDSDDEVPPAASSPAAGSQEADEEVCTVCQRPDNANKMLLCDRCDGEYHIYCLDPPLHAVPDDDWFCPKCSPETTRRKEKSQKGTPPSAGTSKRLRFRGVAAGSESDAEAADAPARKRHASGEGTIAGPSRSTAAPIALRDDSDDDFNEAPPRNRSRHAAASASAADSEDDELDDATQRPVAPAKPNRSLNIKILAAEKRVQQAQADLAELVGDAQEHRGNKENVTAHRVTRGGRAMPTRRARPQRLTERADSLPTIDSSETSASAAAPSFSIELESDADSDCVEYTPLALSQAGKKKRTRARAAPARDIKPQAKQESAAPMAWSHHVVQRQRLNADLDDDMDHDDGGNGGGVEILQLTRIQRMLVRLSKALELPPNPLDYLTHLLGGEEKVAEMTGRPALLKRNEDGTVTHELRCRGISRKNVNMMEKEAFMSGRKLVAIISEAASTGISLQADKRAENQRRRCHLTLELPWSADKAIQQFGRSHRSNQASAPVYRIIMTDCGGEYRFASSAAKKLMSLGALLKGDRRAMGAGCDLKEFDVDNKLGRHALIRTYADIMAASTAIAMPGVQIPKLDRGIRENLAGNRHGSRWGDDLPDDVAFYLHCQQQLLAVGLIERDPRGRLYMKESLKSNVARFLNRLLGLKQKDQALLFDYFSATLDTTIQAEKTRGKFDGGIVSLRLENLAVTHKELVHVEPNSGAETYHTTLQGDRGLSWADAFKFLEKHNNDRSLAGQPASRVAGFYVDRRVPNQGQTGHPYICLATEASSTSLRFRGVHMRIQRPNNTHGPTKELDEVREAYTKVTEARAKKTWEFWHKWSEKNCTHGHVCSRQKRGEGCGFGVRTQELHLISGAVLPVWQALFDTVMRSSHGSSTNADGETAKGNPRVVRAHLADGSYVIGLSVIPEDAALFEDAVEDLCTTGSLKCGRIDRLAAAQGGAAACQAAAAL